MYPNGIAFQFQPYQQNRIVYGIIFLLYQIEYFKFLVTNPSIKNKVKILTKSIKKDKPLKYIMKQVFQTVS
jgi:hypothetical protein